MATLTRKLSPSEAAARLGVSKFRIVQLANAGKIPAEVTTLGRLFDPADVERLAVERRAAPAFFVRKRPPT